MAPHLNPLVGTVQMRSQSICFYAELTKHVPNYHQILPFILSSDVTYILFGNLMVKDLKMKIVKFSNSPEQDKFIELALNKIRQLEMCCFIMAHPVTLPALFSVILNMIQLG